MLIILSLQIYQFDFDLICHLPWPYFCFCFVCFLGFMTVNKCLHFISLFFQLHLQYICFRFGDGGFGISLLLTYAFSTISVQLNCTTLHSTPLYNWIYLSWFRCQFQGRILEWIFPEFLRSGLDLLYLGSSAWNLIGSFAWNLTSSART